ncbi:MAG: glycine cleavage system protein [Bacillales bacterium]|jgi:aminomethyltransferase|nr:glycine cleavage system protein [Bacillales bacterium]
MSLKRTPLFDVYKKYGAKTIDFGGWELPVQFSSIKEEHIAVREKAGLFDVSHMGEISVKGEKSLQFLQILLTNDITKITPGKIIYTLMCYEDGTVVDDLLVYMIGIDEYLLVVNASNTEKDYEWITSRIIEGVTIENVSAEWSQLAIQGPNAVGIIEKLTQISKDEIKYFTFFDEVNIAGVSVLLSRTGYTGEDGYEIYCKNEDSIKLWNVLMEAGEEFGLIPCGLGARDTLRFEVKYPLYGQEISDQITPLEAGLNFAVKLQKEEDFIGKKSLVAQKEAGVPRKLVGIEMIDNGIPRHGYEIFIGNVNVGHVTTGTQVPSTKRNVGLALIRADLCGIGTLLDVVIRNKKLRAEVIQTPFYKR